MIYNINERTPLLARQESDWNEKNSAGTFVANNNNSVMDHKEQREKEREPVYYLDWS